MAEEPVHIHMVEQEKVADEPEPIVKEESVIEETIVVELEPVEEPIEE